MTSQWSFATRTYCKRGHPLNAENTRPFPSGRRECRECHRYRDRRHKRGYVVVNNVCPRGHKYTAENTYIRSGKRRCRACAAFEAKKQYQKVYSYRNRSTRVVCYVVGCRDHAYDGLACVAHRAMLWLLDAEYRAYWRSIGAYEGALEIAA